MDEQAERLNGIAERIKRSVKAAEVLGPWIRLIIIVFVCVGVLYWQGRLESDQQKRDRIESAMSPWVAMQDQQNNHMRELLTQQFALTRDMTESLRQHERIGAHQSMDERASAIEMRLANNEPLWLKIEARLVRLEGLIKDLSPAGRETE